MRECSHSGRRCGARNSCVCLFETSFQTLAQAGDCLAFLLSRGLLHPFVPAESPRQAPCAIHGEGQRPDLGAGQQPGLLLTRQINPELFEGSLSSPGASSSSAAAWGCCRHSPQPLRSGGATGSRVTAAPRLRPCTGQASELSVSSCWASSPQPTYALDRPWTTPWLQPSLSTATGVLDRL